MVSIMEYSLPPGNGYFCKINPVVGDRSKESKKAFFSKGNVSLSSGKRNIGSGRLWQRHIILKMYMRWFVPYLMAGFPPMERLLIFYRWVRQEWWDGPCGNPALWMVRSRHTGWSIAKDTSLAVYIFLIRSICNAHWNVKALRSGTIRSWILKRTSGILPNICFKKRAYRIVQFRYARRSFCYSMICLAM